FPLRLILNQRDSAALIPPALEILCRIAAQLFRLREEIDLDVLCFFAQMPRHHEAVSAVVALPAKHADAPGRLGVLMRVFFEENVRGTFARALHQRQAGYIKALRRKT